MKTFKDLKAGDKLYSYYFCFLNPDSISIFDTQPAECVVISVNNDIITYKTKNGQRTIPVSDSTVMNCRDAFTDYCFYPISTYNYITSKGKIREELSKEWNILIHDRMKTYAENICSKIYTEMHIDNKHNFTDDIKIEYIDRVTYIDKLVPICDKFTKYSI